MSPVPVAILLLSGLILWLGVTGKLDAVWAALQGGSPSPSASAAPALMLPSTTTSNAGNAIGGTFNH